MCHVTYIKIDYIHCITQHLQHKGNIDNCNYTNIMYICVRRDVPYLFEFTKVSVCAFLVNVTTAGAVKPSQSHVTTLLVRP